MVSFSMFKFNSKNFNMDCFAILSRTISLRNIGNSQICVKRQPLNLIFWSLFMWVISVIAFFDSIMSFNSKICVFLNKANTRSMRKFAFWFLQPTTKCNTVLFGWIRSKLSVDVESKSKGPYSSSFSSDRNRF